MVVASHLGRRSSRAAVAAGGAISISHLTAGTGTTDPVTTASVTVASGAALLITVGASVTSPPEPSDSLSLTSTGLGTIVWTKLGTVVYGSRRRAWLYRGDNGAGTGTVSIEHLGLETIQEWGWSLDQVTGHDAVTPTEGFAVAAATTTTAPVTSPGSLTSGDATYSSLCLESNINATPEAGWTGLGQTTTGSLGVRRVESAWKADPGDLTQTWTWDGTSQGSAAFIVIINKA